MTTGSFGRSDADVWTCTYRLLRGNDSLVYVGVTDDFESRMYNHSKKFWWPEVAHKDVIWFPDRLSALYEESQAIDYESPTYNERKGLSPIGYQPLPRGGDLPFLATRYDQDRFFMNMRYRDVAQPAINGAPQEALVVSIDWFIQAKKAMGEPVDFDEMPTFPIDAC